MSLWNKPLSGVTFEDVQAFCDAKIPENIRIDYKDGWPSKLSKQIAAFANTYGGLLIVGVKEDSDTRTVESIPGVEGTNSASERVIQAGQSLAPAVMVDVSDAISLPDAPDRSVYVVRVPQSRLAPHVDSQKDRVHIRTGDVSHPIENADLQRIEQLLLLRNRWESERERLLDTAKDRFKLVRGGQLPTDPYGWISIRPEYPVGEMISADTCFKLVPGTGDRVRVAGGALSIHRRDVSGTRQVVRMGSLTTMGDLFDVRTQLAQVEDVQLLHVETLATDLRHALTAARELYTSDECSFFGPVRITLGVERCRGAVGHHRGHWRASHSIIDESFSCEALTDTGAIIESDLRSQLRMPFEHEILLRCCSALGFPDLPPDAFSS